ncbi:MAG: SMC-Scp complex subunit ScpB [Lachnospiraceae bacterium]|nr:SMC-Scp complex subunit ScpB [Lachnospiraceae bacterium]
MSEFDQEQKTAALEAVLFTMGSSVKEDVLARALEVSEEELEDLASCLQSRYEEADRGIRIIRLEDAYQLVTKKEYYEVLIRIASQPAKPVLTDVMMEVLSIIAYKQPVTRSEIERIRGVSSDYSINRLIEFNLVEEKGRQDSPGRPILFGTTEEFLRRFGLSSVSELPPIDEELLARAAALEEDETSTEMEGQMRFPISEDGRILKEEEAAVLMKSGASEGPITVEV